MTEGLNIVECVQGDAEWFASRVGCLTSSRIADAIAKRKRGNDDLQCRIDLRMELAVERVTGKMSEHYVSKWMERGLELEPLARAAYELRRELETQQVGFVLHPTILWAGCSPDGLIGSDGMVEFKVPKRETHANYLIADVVPEQYRPQMMWQLACCPDRKWNDFVSWCPDFPEPLDLFICRMKRDDAQIAEMEAEAVKLLADVETMVVQLKEGMAGVLRMSVGRK